MDVIIPVGLTYYSSVSGSVFKLVSCAQCKADYVYELRRSASGKGESFLFLDNRGAEDRAKSKAEDQLRRKLEKGLDVVPCPTCGTYQADMLPKARREYRRWMFYAGLCLTAGLIPLFVIGMILNQPRPGLPPLIPWGIFNGFFLAAVSAGVVLLIAKYVVSHNYDPNSRPVEQRKQIGQNRAVLREEFERDMDGEDLRRHGAGKHR